MLGAVTALEDALLFEPQLAMMRHVMANTYWLRSVGVMGGLPLR
jgi:hypothetical protein